MANTRSTPDVLGLCLDARTGKILWDVLVPGQKSESYVEMFISEPTPIADDTRVWFSSSSGGMMCLDHSGKEIWRRVFDVDPLHHAQFCQPQMVDGKLIHVGLKDSLPHPLQLSKNSGKGPWSYLQALDPANGKPMWTAEVATSVFSAPGFAKLGDQWVLFHGRGGPHHAPETPYGFSITSADAGKTIWNRSVDSGFSFYVSHLNPQHAYAFDTSTLLALDVKTGQIDRKIDLVNKVDWNKYNPSTQKIELQSDVKFGKESHPSYHSNILVGQHILFMAHNHPSIGRVNVESGKVEYLQVPYQVERKAQAAEQTHWDSHIPSSPKNSRGMNVGADHREAGSGWGHVTVPAPIAVNGKVYFVTMIGTVYVVDANAKRFEESALKWVGDLGPAGQTWTLASMTYAVCIGQTTEKK